MLCAKRGRVTRTRLYVHHIIPLKVDYSKRLDDSNLITLCYGCHELVHGKRKHRRQDLRPEWW
ncbi:HNH endonuclease [Globicatella sanguinis]